MIKPDNVLTVVENSFFFKALYINSIQRAASENWSFNFGEILIFQTYDQCDILEYRLRFLPIFNKGHKSEPYFFPKLNEWDNFCWKVFFKKYWSSYQTNCTNFWF